MRDRANSALSDVLMSDSLDDGDGDADADVEADSPNTNPSEYSHSADGSIVPEGDQVPSVPTSTEVDEDDLGVAAPGLDKSVASSPLFRLPRELRERIYSYCLSFRYPTLWPADRCSSALQVQLLRTCRTILNEAAPLMYAANMLHFQHPSDCNMFLWAHNPDLGRLVSKIMLQLKDRDVRPLWTPYLGSTTTHRSLLNDYPRLQTLHVKYKSSFILVLGGTLEERFRRWDGDRHLRDLCLSLEGRTPEGCDVKVLVCTRMAGRDVQHLVRAFPEDFTTASRSISDYDEGIIVRTLWRPIFRANVALELEGSPMERIMGP